MKDKTRSNESGTKGPTARRWLACQPKARMDHGNVQRCGDAERWSYDSLNATSSQLGASAKSRCEADVSLRERRGPEVHRFERRPFRRGIRRPAPAPPRDIDLGLRCRVPKFHPEPVAAHLDRRGFVAGLYEHRSKGRGLRRRPRRRGSVRPTRATAFGKRRRPAPSPSAEGPTQRAPASLGGDHGLEPRAGRQWL